MKKCVLIFLGIATVAVIVGITLYFTIGTSEQPLTLLLKNKNGRIIHFDPVLESYSVLVNESEHGITSFASYLDETVYYATTEPNSPIVSLSEEYRNPNFHTREWIKTAIAVDYATEKLYVLDRQAKKIYVIGLKDDYYTTIVSSGLRDPIDMVLDVKRGVILVLQTESIFLAYMDGNSGEQLVDHGSPELVAFTIDRSAGTVYYADSEKIYGHNYDKNRGEEIPSLLVKNVQSLAFADNQLFFIAPAVESKRTLMSCHTDNRNVSVESGCGMKILFTDDTLDKVTVYDVHPPTASSYCEKNNGGCDQICLHSGAMESCACTEGWKNSSNKCIPQDELYVKTADSWMRRFDLQDKIPTETAIDNERDMTPFEILSKVELKMPDITANWMSSGLAIDFASKNLYVVNEINGQINVAKMNSEFSTTISSGLEKPKNIVLDLESNLMFIQQASSVLQMQMDGTAAKGVFVDPEVTAIAVDHRNKKLYIAASKSIASVQYETNVRHKVADLGDGEAVSLAVISGDLYAVVAKFANRSIEHCPLSSGIETCQLTSIYKDNSLLEIKSLLDMKVEPKSPCTKNGGCQQLCLPKSEKEFRCACSYGYKLNPDKKTCMVTS